MATPTQARDRENSTSLRGRLLGPGALLLLVVLFFWKLVLTNQYSWLESPDLAYQVLPWFQFQAGEWHHGSFPLWEPNGWLGQPLFGQGQPGSAYPLNWLLFLFPLKHGWIREAALNWYFVLIHYFAALACYALARDLGRSRIASVFAGCIYGLGGYVAYTNWPQNVNGAVWTPLVFLYLFRAERGRRPWASALTSGFFLGFGWLAGHHQMNLFVSLAAAGLWIWLCVRERKVNWRIARLAACSLVVAAMASAFVTLPMAEYGRLAVRWAGAAEPLHFNETVPYPVHEQFSLKPVEWLGIFIPDFVQNYSPYAGIVALALGILGAALAWRTRQVRWLCALALGGLFFALGPNSVFHGILYSLAPLVEKARSPSAAVLLFSLGLAPLAAYGLDLLPGAEAWLRRAGRTLAGIAAVVAVCALVFFAVKIPFAGGDRLTVPAIAAALACAVFAGWRARAISAPAGSLCLIALALFELANGPNLSPYSEAANAPANLRGPYLHRLAEHNDLIDYVRRNGEAIRIDYDRDAIPYNLGDWYGVDAFSNYVPSLLDRTVAMDGFAPSSQTFFGVRYYIGAKPRTPGQVEVFTGRSGLKIYENAAAFPRVWSVHRIAPAGVVRDPAFDARRNVVVSGPPPPDISACSSANDEVQMPLHRPNLVRITANLKCRGMVILTDAWFPGWRATVDSQPARIYLVDGGVRGVVTDAGMHTVEMKYRPLSVFFGGALTLAAALIAALAWFMGRLRPFAAHSKEVSF
ncbi:MAG TPA: YfhO family protein [Bryobacteraceae bacterium]